MIILRCSRCDKEIEVHEPLGNQSITCPHCGQILAKGMGAGHEDGPGSIDVTIVGPERRASVDTDAKDFPFLKPSADGTELGWLGRYRVMKLLGAGGMAMVFAAEDTRLQRSVALKVMKPELARASLAAQRFLREARVMASLHNDHIVTIFEVGEQSVFPFLAMELLQGEPLDSWLRQNRASPAEVLDLSLQIARGLAVAHKAGLIHRDVKPSNIWVEQPGQRIKLLDFGLARSAQDSSQLTHVGAVVGTPAYMAPEQADGQRADERSDLFSLGCVLYELAAGQQAFVGSSTIGVFKAVALHDPKPLASLNPAMPRAFNDLVEQLLAKKPARRPVSADAVVDALVAMTAAEGLRGSVAPSPRRWRRFWPVAALAGVAALLVLGFVFGPLGTLFHGKGTRTSGAAMRGVTDSEVVLGMSAPFSGPARELGREMEVGIRTYVEHVNDQGGIAGRKLRLVALDDGYEPGRAEANMKELFEKHQVFAVIGNVGTPTAEKALPYALDNRVIFFGAFTGAPLLRKDPPDRYVFNYRASYEEETAAILKFLVDVKKVRPEQVAVFAQQDGYGDAGFRGVARMVRKYGHDSDRLLRVGYARNTTEVDEAVQKVVKDAKLRAVIMVATYRPAARFIQKVKDAGRDLLFANVSFVGSNPLAEELTQLGPRFAEGVIVTQVVPPIQSQATAVQKYRDLLEKYHPNEKPSFVSLEGYLDAMILAEGLRRAGDNLTTDTLIDALEAIHNLDLGLGTPINFSPSEHQASHRVWGTVLDASGRYHVMDLD